MKKATKNAIIIGVFCIVTYLSSYIFRNMLSLFTPQILELKLFSKQSMAFFQSAYMITYAAGQLVNGIIGDYIRPKFMISGGLLISGIGLFMFPFSSAYFIKVIAFCLLGFGLSMLRGPIMKLISENTEPKTAVFICSLFSTIMYLGPTIASVMAIFFKWKSAYTVASALAIGFAVIAFILLITIENKGIISTKTVTIEKKEKSNPLAVFKIKKFIPNMLFCMIIEITATSVSFWIPTYLTEFLSYSKGKVSIVVTIIYLICAISPMSCLSILTLLKGDSTKLNLAAYTTSTVLFMVLAFTKTPIICIVLLLAARMAVCIASATIWSVFIPSLGKTGKTSSANGILDSAGYVAASLANVIFAYIMVKYGWKGEIIAWSLTVSIGFAISLGMRIFEARTPKTEESI